MKSMSIVLLNGRNTHALTFLMFSRFFNHLVHGTCLD